MTRPIYLDYNATTPHAPEVIDAMRPFLESEFGNPSSSHFYGITAKKAVENARCQTADLLGCRPQEIIFTSGGTESINFAIKGVARNARKKGRHIITSQIEHPAVLEVCRSLVRDGFEITYLSVDEYGVIAVSDIENCIRNETILISIMHANNEVGSIQPVREIAAIARKHSVLLHVDAAQSAGKIPVRMEELDADLLSIAGHKIYAPKGIGVLYVREGVEIERLVYGAGQEMGKRAGTENVLEIVGLGKACEIIGTSLEKWAAHMLQMREELYHGLVREGLKIRVNGHPTERLPNTLNLSFKNLESHRILKEIESEVAVSAGAACHSGMLQISHVLTAMDVPSEWAQGAIRFSTGRMTSLVEIQRAVKIIVDAVNRLEQ